MIERYQNVLVLAAHPDDEMGCAGTIRALADAEAIVSMLTFSDCRDLNDAASLRAEWDAALDLLGVANRTMMRLDNRLLPQYSLQIRDQLWMYRQNRYDLVLCPAPSDAHQDHAAVAAEAIRTFKDTTLLGYELPVNAVDSGSPTGFVVLDERHVHVKVEHARQYASQSDKPYMAADFIRALARVRGVQAGVTFAEAFEVVRWVG